jgi:flavin reductase (DIM6/NTAB) family NADH-FMN oxidoreductase RutF
MSSFSDLRIVDNFYQTSSYFPMPTILISTLDEDNDTTLGSYSLCFPYYIAGKEYYAMLLECRNNSNTAQNILRSGKAALNFLPHKRKYFKEIVRLGYPGETSKEKMSKLSFTLEDGHMQKEDPQVILPKVVAESFQAFECTWDNTLEDAYKDQPGQMDGYSAPYRDFNGITSKFGAHFILKIDKILMKDCYRKPIIHGMKAGKFPKVPVDYGYRDSKSFWYTKFPRPISQPIPKGKELDISAVRYAADRIDPDVHFSDEACAKMVQVPRVFLNMALQGCVKWAKEHDVKEITEEHLLLINDKRAKEK